MYVFPLWKKKKTGRLVMFMEFFIDWFSWFLEGGALKGVATKLGGG